MGPARQHHPGTASLRCRSPKSVRRATQDDSHLLTASRAAKICDRAHSEVPCRHGSGATLVRRPRQTTSKHTPFVQALMGGPDLRRCALRGVSFVAVVETADFRHHDDGSDGCLSGRSSIRRVLVEAEMRSASVVVEKVRREDAPKMRLVHDDDVVETLPSDRADHTLDVWILPGTRRRGQDLGDAHPPSGIGRKCASSW